MANRVELELTNKLYNYFQSERFVLLSTIDHETGGPNVCAISWVWAKNEKTILFSVDNRSRIIQNINKNPQVVINVIVDGSSYSISGSAIITKMKMEEVPLKLALIQLNIIEVRDVMFYGSEITAPPEYNKTYDQEAAIRLDHQVMDAMKKV